MISSATFRQPIIKYPQIPFRAQGYSFGDDFAREAITPTDWPLLYKKTAVGTDAAAMSTTINRLEIVTGANAADNCDIATSGLRLDRIYASGYSGMPDLEGDGATTLTLLIPFVCSSGADNEGFVGIVGNSSALAAPPTTARHMGVYWDRSANTDFLITSADGTTQSTTDTNDTVDTQRHILRITWTGADTAVIDLLTGAGALGTATSTQAVAALNGASEVSYEMHWFVETETTAAKQLNAYGWRAKWT